MKKRIIILLLALVLLCSACAQGSPRFRARDIEDTQLLEKLNGSVRINSEGVYTVKVGQAVHFDLYEKQSIPYRWIWHISDDSLAAYIYSVYRDDAQSRPLPGGDSGNRWFYFEALAPGECSIEMRFGRIDEEEYHETCTYTIIIVQE
ncbi:MAG: protease inhibitor I42 family protein [Clostridiales bacterium]|nr:protease inhibitor I42 family protein [Clostridiales bacterium]